MPKTNWVSVTCRFCGSTLVVPKGDNPLMPQHNHPELNARCIGSGCEVIHICKPAPVQTGAEATN